MIEFLVSWAEQLIIALIIIIMLEMIIPNSSYRKYIKIILGIFILYVIFNPLMKNKINNFNIEQELKKQTQTVNKIQNPTNSINYNTQIENVYKQKFKENLYNTFRWHKGAENLSISLNEKGYRLDNINFDVNYNKEKIETNKLELRISKLEENKDIKIDKVKISEEKQEISKQDLEKLKQEISTTYDIDISKILIESEKSQ